MALVLVAGATVQSLVGLGLGLVAAPIVTLLQPDLMPEMLLVLGALLPVLTLIEERGAIDWRGLGWALAAPLVANRDRLPPLGMLEQTGYTGTGVWIDLVTKRFAIILTSRLHPYDRGDAAPLRQQVLALLR